MNDFKFLGEKRFLIRNEYEAVDRSLRVEGKKVQELIDKYLRSTTIYKLVKEKEITNENFLKYVLSRYKTEKARTALVKNKARQVIGEFASHNPIFFEKLRERLEKIIQEEERRRRIEAQDFDEKPYFDKIKEIYEQALSEEKESKSSDFLANLNLQSIKSYFKLRKIRRLARISPKIYTNRFRTKRGLSTGRIRQALQRT